MFKASLGIILLATTTSAASVDIFPDNKSLHKHGRWDANNGTWWPGTGIKLVASNLTTFNLQLGEYTNWPSVAISVSIDYEPWKKLNVSMGANSIPIPAASPSKTRVVRIDVQASTGTRMHLKQIELNEGAKLQAYKPSPLRFQFIGDSLSAGALNPNGVNDCWTFLSSQEFKAEHNIMAQPGICLADRECYSQIHGMSYQYFVTEDTSYRWDVNHNYTTPWNFKHDLPPTHVIIYIGANDSSNNITPEAFTEELIKFIVRLRTLYPHQPLLVFSPWGWSDGTSPFWPFYPGVYENVVKNRTLSGDQNVVLVNTTGWLQKDGVIPGDGHPNPLGQQQVQAKFSAGRLLNASECGNQSAPLYSTITILFPYPIERMEELLTSCDFLDSALERYYNACVAFELGVCHDFAQANLHAAFLKRLADKFTQLTTQKQKLKQCEMVLRRIRNHSPSIVPVNALPPEVLTRIFSMLHSCYFESRTSSKPAVSVYPDMLAQVCSRWRRIAIVSCALWSHVDLFASSNKTLNQKLLSRAKTFHSRSNELPLDIHLVGNSDDGESLARFCAPIAKRVRSLEAFSISTKSLTPVLNACFLHGVPGKLNRLAISGEFDKHSYLWSARTHDYLDSFTALARDDQKRVNEVLPGIQILDLSTNCIPPTSPAYRGLVELRLMGSGMRLAETEFLSILAASPKLRILYLDISIKDASQSPSKVRLDELEVLFLSWVEDREDLVRLLYPGTQPLKLILEARNRLSMSRRTAAAFERFFERSTVTELYISHILGTPGCSEWLFNPFRLLRLMPQIEVLALSGVEITGHGGRLTQTSSSLLRTLHLLDSLIEWDSCIHLIQSYNIEKITIRDCKLYTGTRTSRMQDDQRLIKDIIAGVCPTVQILDHGILELAGMRDGSRGI